MRRPRVRKRLVLKSPDRLLSLHRQAPRSKFFHIGWHQDEDGGQFLSFCRLRVIEETDSGGPILATERAVVFTDSFTGPIEIEGTALPHDDGDWARLSVEGAPRVSTDPDFEVIVDPVLDPGGDGQVRRIELRCDGLFLPDTFSVQAAGPASSPPLVSVGEWENAHPSEWVEDEGVWLRWTSSDRAAVALHNRSPASPFTSSSRPASAASASGRFGSGSPVGIRLCSSFAKAMIASSSGSASSLSPAPR